MKPQKLLLCITLIATSSLASAQTGALDSTFGVNGKVTSLPFTIESVALQSDGKIIGGGTANSVGFEAARFNTDGSIDSSFGLNGISVTPFDANSNNQFEDLVIQPDDKIIEVGAAYNNATYSLDFGIARLNSNGTPDSSFGIDGKVTTTFFGYYYGGYDHAYAVALQPDGKILFGGVHQVNYYYGAMMLIRYNPSGSIDSSFGVNGIDSIFPGPVWEYGNEIEIQPDGKIIFSANAQGTSWPYYLSVYLTRLNSDGSLDGNFNSVFLQPQLTYITGLLIQPDGKIVATGGDQDVVGASTNPDFVVARFNFDGSVDSAFADTGFATTNFQCNNYYNYCGNYSTGMVRQPDGKIVIGGSSGGGGNPTYPLVLLRFNSAGLLDSSFGENGVDTLYGSGNNDFCKSITIQHDGKIIAAGGSLARFLNDTFSCSANFTLIADTLMPHHYWALNLATGTAPVTYNWNWGDGTFDTIAFPSHTYSSGGFYNICLTVSDSTGCTTTYCSYDQLQRLSSENSIVYVDVVSNIPTSVQSNELPSFILFPNPASSKLEISFSQTAAFHKLKIIDPLGRTMQQQIISENQFALDISDLSSGVYFLELQNSTGSAIRKFVKQ